MKPIGNRFNKQMFATLFGIIFVIFIFVFVSILATKFEPQIQKLVWMSSYTGVFLYIFFTAFAIVVAPVSTLPLIPIATNLWGWFFAGILSIFGWLIGSMISFYLARKYGKPFIKKFVSLEKLEKYENYFSEKDTFWTVVFLRMIIPVDVLSYALGLFSKIKPYSFFFSTIIGIIPFAFIFSYTGGMTIGLQIITFIEIGAVLGILYLFRNVLYKKKKPVEKF